MNPDTLLYRMVSPSWIQRGIATSQTFKPTRKDNGRLSVYDGDQITPQDAYEHYTGSPPGLGQTAVGVLAVAVAECESLNLTVKLDGDPIPAHAIIDFTALSRRNTNRAADELKQIANARGWQHRPNPNPPP